MSSVIQSVNFLLFPLRAHDINFDDYSINEMILLINKPAVTSLPSDDVISIYLPFSNF